MSKKPKEYNQNLERGGLKRSRKIRESEVCREFSEGQEEEEEEEA